MEDLKIEYIAIDKLTSYNNNTKIHTVKQIEHIANSIKKFGFNDPLGIYGKNNIVLEGNGRIEAAKRLNMKELPCVRLDHLSTNEMRAYVIAHNSINLETGFDDGVLYDELKKLQDYDFFRIWIGLRKIYTNFYSCSKTFTENNTLCALFNSLPIDENDKAIQIINTINEIKGVQIESTTN